jgi:hypothetical protein
MIPSALREKDKPIMEALLLSKATNQELKYANQCRLFFQTFWLSELCDPDGKSMEPSFLKFNEIHHLPSFSTIRWPYQPAPTRKAFNAWKKLIRKAFLSDKKGRSNNMKIDEPLGKFHNRSRHRTWNWEWDGTGRVTHKFIAETATIMQHFDATIGRSVTIKNAIAASQDALTPMNQMIPLKVKWQTATETSFRKDRVALTDQQQYEQHETSNDWESYLLRNHVTIDPTKEVDLWLNDNTDFCIGVSAQKSGEQTAFGWAISARTGSHGRVTKVGVGKVPKTNQHDTLCTGELVAIHAALYLLRSAIGKPWSTEPATVKISTTNSQTVQILSHLWKTVRHNPRWRLNRNWEILSNIQNDIASNELEMIDPAEDTFGEYAHKAATRGLLEFSVGQEYYRRAMIQPANSTGRAYLRHGIEIINDKYDATIHERCSNVRTVRAGKKELVKTSVRFSRMVSVQPRSEETKRQRKDATTKVRVWVATNRKATKTNRLKS